MSHAPCQPPPCTSIPQPREREESLCPPAPSVEGWGLGKRGLPFRRDRRLSIVTHGPSITHAQHTYTHTRVSNSLLPQRGTCQSFLRRGPSDFPGGPLVKTLYFHCRGHSFDPLLGKFRRLHDAAKRIRGPSVVTGWLNECIRGRTNNRSHLQSDYQLTNSCPIC